MGEEAEERLGLGREGGKVGVAEFNAAAHECDEVGEHGTEAVWEEMVVEEEKHADWGEGQLDARERVGIHQYLAQQIDADAGPG